MGLVFSPGDREAARLLNDLMGWRPRNADAGEASDEARQEEREPDSEAGA
jgi:hypothetical protein